VPNVPRPDDENGWDSWLVQSQRFVDNRPDVATWVSGPLAEDLTIAGDVVAHLFASTTGTDADWVVKLIDVYPDSVADRPAMGGYQLMVNADIMRGRYWKNFRRPRRSRRTPSRHLTSTCTSSCTGSSRAASWCRSRAPGSRSTTATRRLCRQHLPGQANRLQGATAPHLAHAAVSVAPLSQRASLGQPSVS
jgi:hypothetical protein